MRRLLTLFSALTISSIIPCSSFHADKTNHGFYSTGFKVEKLTASIPVVNKSAQFTSANSEYLSRADEASYDTGNIAFSVAGWVYNDTLGGGMTLISKWTNGGPFEYALVVDQGTNDRFEFFNSTDGATTPSVVANTFGDAMTATWYFVFAYHNTDNTIGISVNDGTVDTASNTVTNTLLTSPFTLGAVTAPTILHNGRLQSFGYWNKKLSTAEVTSLYNAGVPLEYCQVSGSLLTSLVAWYNLTEASGTREDSTANNLDLTDNNTVTQADGASTGTCL